MADFRSSKPRAAQVVRHFRSTFILALVAVLLVVVVLLLGIRVEQVAGTQIGLRVNNINGDVTVVEQPGTVVYNGFLTTFHRMDRTVQRLEMTASEGRGERLGKDDLRVKTVDGSDVFVDVTINYKILPDKVEEIALTSGPDNAYKMKWVRDYSRSVCRTVFGEMTTEEFYEASVRAAKETQAQVELNEMLNPYGVEVIKVIAEKFRFHQEYEEKIKEKKLADQEVEEQVSKARAAEQNQEYRRVEAEKAKDVAVAEYEGSMRKLVVDAEAQAERMLQEAEAHAVTATRGAEGAYYEREKNAQAIAARKDAEARATAKMADALEGEGGRNIVKMEYSEKLRDLSISGQPFSVSGQTERFVHVEEAAAAAPRRSAAPAQP